jgi:hypothetical protein
MADSLKPPDSLVASYRIEPSPSRLSAPYAIRAVYDEAGGGEQYNYAVIDTVLDTSFSFEVEALFVSIR